MNYNLTVIQKNNLYEVLCSDLAFAEELMKEFHKDIPDEFTFLEMKRLREWIDGAKDKRDVYAILRHSNMDGVMCLCLRNIFLISNAVNKKLCLRCL